MNYLLISLLTLLSPVSHAHPGHGISPSQHFMHYLIDHHGLSLLFALTLLGVLLYKHRKS